ncbi:MAG TPA: ABC transporter permease subunit [Bacteroidales bacterium]|nr:ABC transporter permease subunit [Bacteroidales bacterium]
MNRNLFRKEMKRHALSLVIWMIVITLLISVTMSAFRTFVENQSKILGMISLIPKGALSFKGVTDINGLFSVLGFYATNNVIYMMLLGSIFAVVISSGILLKEEYQKTAEYLVSRPLTRSEIFCSKAAVVFVHVLLLNLVTALAGLVCMLLVKKEPFSFPAFLVLSLYTFLLNLLFAAAGLLISTLVKRPRPITTVSIGIVMILYFINTIAKITESISWIGYVSPFHYVRLDVVSPAYSAELSNLLFFTGFILLFSVLSYRLYLRKDIYT